MQDDRLKCLKRWAFQNKKSNLYAALTCCADLWQLGQHHALHCLNSLSKHIGCRMRKADLSFPTRVYRNCGGCGNFCGGGRLCRDFLCCMDPSSSAVPLLAGNVCRRQLLPLDGHGIVCGCTVVGVCVHLCACVGWFGALCACTRVYLHEQTVAKVSVQQTDPYHPVRKRRMIMQSQGLSTVALVRTTAY
jgi:hypothetical protein